MIVVRENHGVYQRTLTHGGRMIAQLVSSLTRLDLIEEKYVILCM